MFNRVEVKALGKPFWKLNISPPYPFQSQDGCVFFGSTKSSFNHLVLDLEWRWRFWIKLWFYFIPVMPQSLSCKGTSIYINIIQYSPVSTVCKRTEWIQLCFISEHMQRVYMLNYVHNAMLWNSTLTNKHLSKPESTPSYAICGYWGFSWSYIGKRKLGQTKTKCPKYLTVIWYVGQSKFELLTFKISVELDKN